jgi:hypothetical protein
MGRIIIDNRADIDDQYALLVVARVIQEGRVSNDGKQYAYVTTFREPAVYVVTDLNKASDRFVICNDKSTAKVSA